MQEDDFSLLSNGSIDPTDTTAQTQNSSTDDSDSLSSGEQSDSTDSTRVISPVAQQLIDKFEQLSKDKQMEWLRSAESTTARQAQREAAQHIRDIYGIEPQVQERQTSKSTKDIDAKIQRLEELENRINQKYETIAQKEEGLVKESAIKSYLKDFKIPADAQDVLSDRNFLRSMAETRDSGLSTDRRVKLAMAETYGADASFLEKQSKARQGGMATGNSAQKVQNISWEDLMNPNKQIDAMTFER